MLFGILVWVIVGGIAGWLASVFLRHHAQQAILIDIVAGIVGAYAGGALLAPRLHAGVVGGYAIAVSGAVLVIAVLLAVERIRAR